MIVSTP